MSTRRFPIPIVLAATILGVLLGVLLPSTPARAQPAAQAPSLAVTRSMTVHLGGGFALPTGTSGRETNPGWAELETGVGYLLSPRLELEVGGAWTLPGSRQVRSQPGGAAGESTDLSTRVGGLARGLLRVRLLEGSWHPVLAAGPALAFGGDFGVVPLGQLEAGIEWRGSSGLYLLAALRAYLPMKRSRSEFEPDRCLTMDCPSRFQPGRPILGSRLAVGLSF
jgi:hypothetical protein